MVLIEDRNTTAGGQGCRISTMETHRSDIRCLTVCYYVSTERNKLGVDFKQVFDGLP